MQPQVNFYRPFRFNTWSSLLETDFVLAFLDRNDPTPLPEAESRHGWGTYNLFDDLLTRRPTTRNNEVRQGDKIIPLDPTTELTPVPLGRSDESLAPLVHTLIL